MSWKELPSQQELFENLTLFLDRDTPLEAFVWLTRNFDSLNIPDEVLLKLFRTLLQDPISNNFRISLLLNLVSIYKENLYPILLEELAKNIEIQYENSPQAELPLQIYQSQNKIDINLSIPKKFEGSRIPHINCSDSESLINIEAHHIPHSGMWIRGNGHPILYIKTLGQAAGIGLSWSLIDSGNSSIAIARESGIISIVILKAKKPKLLISLLLPKRI